MSILVVDDEAVCADSLALGLRLKGHDVQIARGGREALEWLEQNSTAANLVLLDIMMPEIDGLEVLASLKKNETLSSIPVVLQTGISDMRAIERGMELGARTWIQKPFSNKQITSLVDTILHETYTDRDPIVG